MLVTQLCPTLCDPMDCSRPGSSVHGILQARILQWVFQTRFSSPRDLPDPGIEPRSSALLEKAMAPTPVLLPGKSHGWRSLVGCSPWGLEESDTTEWLQFHFSLSCIGEGNGNPLQDSCLENPRDGGAWWAAIYGVTQSRTRLKRLTSSSSSSSILAWRIPWTDEPGRLPSMQLQRVRHDGVTFKTSYDNNLSNPPNHWLLYLEIDPDWSIQPGLWRVQQQTVQDYKIKPICEINDNAFKNKQDYWLERLPSLTDH